MTFDIFGTLLAVEKQDGHWRAYYLGNEGKRRPAADILIPDELNYDEIVGYLDDLLHERATANHPRVTQLN